MSYRCHHQKYLKQFKTHLDDNSDVTSLVIFSSELQKRTGVRETDVRAQDYRSLVTEITDRYEGLSLADVEDMSVAINGEIIAEPMLEKISPGSEVHFLYRIEGG